MHNLTTAEFFGTPVSIIDHADRKWLTSEQVGRCLGYSEANARQGINKLYDRHKDEFTEADTCVVKLTSNPQVTETDTFEVNLTSNSQRGNPTTRIFSATGCVVLGWLSNTTRAKEFKQWAKHHLAAQLEGEKVAFAVESRLDRLEEATLTLASHMQKLVEVSRQQVRKLDVTARYIALLEINQRGRSRVTPRIMAEVPKLRAQGLSLRDIGYLLRISSATASQICSGKYPLAAREASEWEMTDELELEAAREQAIARLKGGRA